MVVVDHFSKGAHFIPANESWSASQLANAFVDCVFRLHGLPDKIVSDRGSTFVSRFWTSVLDRLGIKSAPSTAFHPQTDGQVERLNAVLEDFLRHFVSDQQDDWVSWLSLAEFSHNNTVSASTGFSPFFAMLGYHPRFGAIAGASKVAGADAFVSHMQQVQQALEGNLAQAKERQAKYYNAGRRVDVVYRPGDLVWLSRKFIKTRRPCQKLDFRRVGPFRVRRMVGKNAVELELSELYARLHPVFNVSLVMPVVSLRGSGEDLMEEELLGGQVTAQVARLGRVTAIVGHRFGTEGHEYLLRGGDGRSENDKWVPLDDMARDLDKSPATKLRRMASSAPLPVKFVRCNLGCISSDTIIVRCCIG